MISRVPREAWKLDEEPELEVGSDGTGGPTEFFQVEAVRFLSDKGFVVANRGSEELRFFDPNGHFEGMVGGRGRGPEEFTGLSWVAILGDSLLTYDWGNDRISVWSRFRGYGRSFRLEWVSGLIAPLVLLEDGTLLSLAVRHMTELEGSGTLRDVGLISRHDRTGALIDSLGRFPVGERVIQREGTLQTTVSLPLGAEARFTAQGDGFCYVFGSDFEIRCYADDGSLRSSVRVDSVPKKLEPGDIEQAFQYELEAARAGGNEPRIQALRRTRPSMTFPESLPAFADLIADDEDRLWVRQFGMPGQVAAEWWVFDEGRWLAQVSMDPAYELMDVSQDYLIGVWCDDLGIEKIRVYRYARG